MMKISRKPASKSSSVITVEKFVPASDIPPIYLDAGYYLAPDGEAGQDVYVVLREAMKETGQAALSRVVISRRERPVAILPMDGGLVLYTLHEKRDINDPSMLFDPVAQEKADTEMVKLARQLIERQEAEFEPADIKDRYEQRLRDVIEAKLQGEGITTEAPAAPRRDNVVDLMAALKASLGRNAASAKSASEHKAKPTRKSVSVKAAAASQRPTRKRA